MHSIPMYSNANKQALKKIAKSMEEESLASQSPSHLRFSATDLVLEHVVEVGVPKEGLGGGRRAADVEMGEGVVVGGAVEVLGFQNDAIAVKDESFQRRCRCR